MRIRQANVTSKFFREAFKNKFNLGDYMNTRRPVVFFGCYAKNLPQVFTHEGLCVIVWAGSDSMHLSNNTYLVRRFLAKKNIKHIALSNFISADLKAVGIEHKILPIIPFDNSDFKPVPLGNKIYIYQSHINPKLYGSEIIEKVKRNFPKIEFITCYAQPPDSIPRCSIKKIYEKCALGLRLTPHDGMSNTVIEMGLMGRKCIWNGNSPNAIPWKYVIDICENIEKELSRAGQLDNELAAKVNEFINIDNNWLKTEFYE